MTTKKSWRRRGVVLLVFLFTSLSASTAGAQTTRPATVERKTLTADQKGELQLAAARTNPLQLRQFLKKMPKGTELHYHLGGGVYAESFIRAAVEDGLCVDAKELALVKCAANRGLEHSVVPASDAYKNQSLYDQLVDSLSMRNFVPCAGVSGYDHFFDTFAKFRALGSTQDGEWVDEVASRAAAQNVQYMELMETPDFAFARKLSQEIPWNDDLKVLRDDLLKHNLQENVRTAITFYREIEKKRRELEKCGQPSAAEACKVEVRFLCQVLRGLPKETVFAQALLCFEAAAADPEKIVGLNLVMPEDGRIAMEDYALHMRMVKYLHETYPSVHITLHAGELAYGLVPPEGLCCHVRLAVEAGAERIGHGADVMFEDRPHELLKEMAAKHVMVEVNLTSGDLILGVSDKNLPLPLYRQFGVPVALSTDDEGVSRIDLTHEYVRAVETYGLKYVELKNMARTGLEHAFLPGESLWAERDRFTKAVAACAKDNLGSEQASTPCAELLKASKKAQQQWELERRFRLFEAEF